MGGGGEAHQESDQSFCTVQRKARHILGRQVILSYKTKSIDSRLRFKGHTAKHFARQQYNHSRFGEQQFKRFILFKLSIKAEQIQQDLCPAG